MVCCRLIKAPTELERTQDMHNGTVELRSHVLAAGITQRAPLFYDPRQDTHACAQMPGYSRPYAHRESAPEVTGPTRRHCWIRKGRGESCFLAIRRGLRVICFHEFQGPSATAIHPPWCRSSRENGVCGGGRRRGIGIGGRLPSSDWGDSRVLLIATTHAEAPQPASKSVMFCLSS